MYSEINGVILRLVQISPAMRHSCGDGTISDDVRARTTNELSALLPLLSQNTDQPMMMSSELLERSTFILPPFSVLLSPQI